MASRSAIDNFPPVPALSDRQSGVEILLCIKVDPKEYASFTFCPKFKEIYGEPTQYYSDFYRLMTTPFDQNLFPKFRMSFLKFATTINLVDFYTQVDQIALGRSLPVLGRREMEAGWTQYFTMRYAADAEKDIPVLIKEKDSVHTEDGACNYLQVLLRKGIGQIFDSNPKVEAYWEKKGVKYASLQLEIEVSLIGFQCTIARGTFRAPLPF